MRMKKQKHKLNSPQLTQPIDDDNEFLDDFLKPPQKIKESSRKFQLNRQPTIKQLHHNSVPTRLPKNHSERLQVLQHTEVNKQVQHILKTIKKQEEIRREKTRQFLQKVAAEKEEEKKLHEFKIAQRRIKKRLMLMERREQLQQELLSFVHQNFDQTITRHLKEKAKSVDDVTNNASKSPNRRPTPLQARTKELTRHEESYRKKALPVGNVMHEKIELSSTEHYLPQINNGSAVSLKGRRRISRVSTITLTKELRIEEDVPKPKEKHKDYLAEFKYKRRNYTESNAELQKLYEEGNVSREKTERVVELATKLENKRRLKLKNLNEMDYKQAQRKIQLLNFLHRQV